MLNILRCEVFMVQLTLKNEPWPGFNLQNHPKFYFTSRHKRKMLFNNSFGSPAEYNVKTTSYIIINSTTETYCSVAFI